MKQKHGNDHEVHSRTRKATSDLCHQHAVEKQKYSKLPQGDTVALGLARKNETIRKGLWAVTQIYLKNSQNQW